MTGEVLYRKWRPPRFADIVGQGPVTQTLTQAVATGRTSHAYLLCGPRGTGKTSTARVLAKALNCTLRPPGFGDPCGNCPTCLAIEQGNFVDLIEIDAASNRGIDEMRDLREKVRFSPTQGKYKVYIIDEAHALTNDAFNAFLKTLEEPPPHSVFVLATTEPHRLPATIVSRCQRYDFHRIAPGDVVDRLTEIATAEGVNVSPEVLRTVSRASGGSLRDATNLLDQLITSFGANVSIEQVRELLGIGGEERAVALVKHLLTNNTTAALELINAVTSEGQDLRPLHRMTVDFLRAALLMKSGVKDSLELSKEAYAELSFAATNTTMEHLLRALRMFGQVSLKFDQPSPLPLELATVELSLDPPQVAVAQAAPMAQAPAPVQQPQQQASPQRAPQQQSYPQQQQRPQQAPAPSSAGPPQGQAAPQAPAAARPPATPPPPVQPVEIDPNAPVEERLVAAWPNILRAMSRVPRRRFDVAALLRSSSKRTIVGDDLLIRFTHTSNSERLQDELEDPRCRLEVERILEQALGANYGLKVETDSNRNTANLNADQPGHLVRAAMSLGGQVIQNGTQASEAPVAPPVEVPVAQEPVPEPVTAPEAAAEVPVAEPVVAETPGAPVAQEPASEPEPVATPEVAAEVPAPEPVVAESPATEPVGQPSEPTNAEPVAATSAPAIEEPAVVVPAAVAAVAPEAAPEPADEPPAEPMLAEPMADAVASAPQAALETAPAETAPALDESATPEPVVPEVVAEAPVPEHVAPVAEAPAPEAAPAAEEAPVMARNLFNEMQAIPQPPADEDEDEPPLAAAALPHNQIPADYFPGPDEEEMNA